MELWNEDFDSRLGGFLLNWLSLGESGECGSFSGFGLGLGAGGR